MQQCSMRAVEVAETLQLKKANTKGIRRLLMIFWAVAAFFFWYVVVPTMASVKVLAFALQETMILERNFELVHYVNPLTVALGWLGWLVVIIFIRRDRIWATLLAIVLSVLCWFLVAAFFFLMVVASMFKGSFDPNRFPQLNLEQQLQGRVLIKSDIVNSEVNKELLVATSPDGKKHLFLSALDETTASRDILLRTAETETVLFHEIALAPGFWKQFYWADDSQLLVICFDQASGNPTDPYYIESCFLYNPTQPDAWGVVKNPDQFVSTRSSP